MKEKQMVVLLLYIEPIRRGDTRIGPSNQSEVANKKGELQSVIMCIVIFFFVSRRRMSSWFLVLIAIALVIEICICHNLFREHGICLVKQTLTPFIVYEGTRMYFFVY
ncbi:hypothetical protein OPV22_027233 [Ensete ventricosum]|uniref:Uncharacterized protein n=1 Tax=Ensete ventricosum TaxID=4639 RepID=A0AAV8PX26_ENSVE|nr:hypothetical protein OPV22_027233 [Ensete ventricosum]